jgi:glycosyltransferase involved in cell wall biosynthesis
VPQFPGHYQPHLPYDGTFYDLTNIDVMRSQVALAKNYGIFAFCFHYYWFGGKRLLDKPLDNFLSTKEGLDFPFCINYANENWCRRWDGSDDHILIKQEHSDEDDLACITDICRYVRDERYVKINGKPLIIIYNATVYPDVNKTIGIWRDYCRNAGIGEIHLISAQTYPNDNPLIYDFDDVVEFPPHFSNVHAKRLPLDDIQETSGKHEMQIYDTEDYIINKRYLLDSPERMYRTVFPGWDNTARRGASGVVYPMTPELYKRWLLDVMNYTKQNREPGDRLVFINSWNEWAEGAHLEPDRKFGYAYLQATADATVMTRNNSGLNSSSKRSIIYVSHDAHPHGAQMLSVNIIRQLSEVFKYNVHVIVKSGGALLSDMFKYATSLINLDSDTSSAEYLKDWVAQTGAVTAMCNTVVTGDILKNLSDLGVTCISMIHEMENAVREYQCEGNLALISSHAKKIVLPSRYVLNSLSNIESLPDEKVEIFPQGIYKKETPAKSPEECRKEIIARFNLPDNCSIVLNVGFADHRKGVDLFAKCAINLCSELDNCVFLWVGAAAGGASESALELVKGTAAEGQVVFAGLQDEMYPFYLACDVFLLTSREDPFPSVVMEAMSYLKPVIAFDGGGGYVELLTHGETGFLAPMEDVEQMSGFVKLLLSDTNLRVSVGETGGKLVSVISHFNSYVGKLLALLDEKHESVSVIIPNYNYAHYLRERIESVLSQTYPISEIIILDDASTDESLDIIRHYEKKYPLRITVIPGSENSGNVFSQWERGLKASKGAYVWIAEADDKSDPSFLQSLMDVMSLDKHIVLGYTQSKIMDEGGAITAKNYLSYTDYIDSEKYKADYIADGHNEIKNRLAVKNTIPNVSAVVLKNSDRLPGLIADAKKYKVAGDLRFYIDILKDGGKLLYIAKSLNYHRRHTSSVTKELDAQRHYDEICECQQYVADLFSDGNLHDMALGYRRTVRDYLFNQS